MKNRLAILDDEPSIAMIIELNLSDTFDIVAYQEKEEFEQGLNEATIDALVLDLNLAGDSGKDLIVKIREGNYPNLKADIPLVILSGEESTDEKIHCLEIGADDYLVKPFNPLELKVRLQRIFSRMYAQ